MQSNQHGELQRIHKDYERLSAKAASQGRSYRRIGHINDTRPTGYRGPDECKQISEEKMTLQQQKIESMSKTSDETNRELDAVLIMQSNQHVELQRIHKDYERLC